MGSIVVVQADPDTHAAWTDAISGAGHDVTAVAGLRQALPLIRDGGIEVVVIGAYDPRVGVIELARAIEALPDAPPVILVSSSPFAPELSARMGAAVFLPAPCDPAELVSAIARLVDGVRPVLVVEDEPTGPHRHAM